MIAEGKMKQWFCDPCARGVYDLTLKMGVCAACGKSGVLKRYVCDEDWVNQRTNQQNRAFHKLFDMTAKVLNNKKIFMDRLASVETPERWTADVVKEYLWRDTQKQEVKKDSTTELSTAEVNIVFKALSLRIKKQWGVTIIFPSMETMQLSLMEPPPENPNYD